MTKSRPYYLFPLSEKARTELLYAFASLNIIPRRPPIAFYSYQYSNFTQKPIKTPPKQIASLEPSSIKKKEPLTKDIKQVAKQSLEKAIHNKNDKESSSPVKKINEVKQSDLIEVEDYVMDLKELRVTCKSPNVISAPWRHYKSRSCIQKPHIVIVDSPKEKTLIDGKFTGEPKNNHKNIEDEEKKFNELLNEYAKTSKNIETKTKERPSFECKIKENKAKPEIKRIEEFEYEW